MQAKDYVKISRELGWLLASLRRCPLSKPETVARVERRLTELAWERRALRKHP